jgi:hypothetical protein
VKELPRNLAAVDTEALTAARDARDDELTGLFRRWPRLNTLETRQLRRLYDERVRLAKYLGHRRTRRVSK